MAMAVTIYNNTCHPPIFTLRTNSFPPFKRVGSINHINSNNPISFSLLSSTVRPRLRCGGSGSEPEPETDVEADSVGVQVALSMLKFYKREISPILPKSCRYVPTCSEYSMIAYKKYGVVKGTILTAWRLCRCNPLGGSGFDPPRWFGEERTLEE